MPSNVGWWRLLFAALFLALPSAAFAVDEPPPTTEERLAAAEAAVADAALAGHNAWMLTSAALVLFMTAPGLAMFYSGLVRKKNVLGVMMQCIFLMGLMTVIWALYGYSLAFGGAPPAANATPEEIKAAAYSPYLGNFEFVAMRGVQRKLVSTTVKDEEGKDQVVHTVETPMEGAIPRLTHMLFQGMFFIITPALICGAFAERMKFSTMVVFSILWGTLVYCPLCHWVWDSGILAFGPGLAGGALDFAGGTVVHISSGVSALVCALVIGKRLSYGSEPMPPHNLTYTVLGAAMLWVGWFGFNAGSELASDGLAASAFCVTHFAAAAGTLAWAGMEWAFRGKPSVLGAASGAVAGLVCITPASGYVQPIPALAMGAAAGVVCFAACTKLKHKFGYDDSLDAFGVHGVGGTLGAILTGVFATKEVADVKLVSGGNPVGLIDGNYHLLIGQALAVVITWIFAAVLTFVLLKILDVAMGLRVSRDAELMGLDLSQHGEEGYIFL
ncbi:MAG: ammonium transporter [Pirellulaceae bacterium]|nr:ammonium transporter [Pirellulaceae bacterium]